MCHLVGFPSTPAPPISTASARRPPPPSGGSPADGGSASGGRERKSRGTASSTEGAGVGQGTGKRDSSEKLDDESHGAGQDGNHKSEKAAEHRARATVPERTSSGSPPEPPPHDPPEGDSPSPTSSTDDESILEGEGAPSGSNHEDESPQSTSPAPAEGGQGTNEHDLPETSEADGTPEEDQGGDGKTTHEVPPGSGPSSATSGDGGPTSGVEVDTDGHDHRDDDGEASARSKGPKKAKKPRRIGGRRTGMTSNAHVKRASFTPRPELICRKTPGSVQWEIALSVHGSATSVKQNGEPLSPRNGSWPLARFAGDLSVNLKEGPPVTFLLLEQSPLIFKLKKDWRGDGRRVPRVTKGHFIVIAPVEWGVPLGRAPVEPECCSDRAFMAHYFFRDGTESRGRPRRLSGT